MTSQSNKEDYTAVGATIDIVGIAIGNRGLNRKGERATFFAC